MAEEKKDEKDKDQKENRAEEGAISDGKTDEQVRKETLLGLTEDIKDFKNYTGRYRSVKNETYKDYTYKGGFYYDSQLEDPYMSISLHANTKIIEGEWKEWPGDHLEPILKKEGGASDDKNWSESYGVDPIARCIMSEDFSYSIANNFSDYNGGNPIEGLFESLKPYAPILEKFGKNLEKATENTDSMGSDAVGWFTNIGKKAAKIMRTSSSYLNKALFVQGSRFSYYSGTQFSFNNMEMKFLVFSDYVTTGDGNWEFQSVEDYIKTLQPYVMGVYSPYSADFLRDTGFQGDAKEFIKQYVGFQEPPGGFTMDTKALNNTLKGTLRMNIGGTWAIENLVLKNMNVNMSRVQAKHPENPGETVPLYADITLQLAPAAALVDTGYRRILSHTGLGEIRRSIKEGYSQSLESLKKTYTGNK